MFDVGMCGCFCGCVNVWMSVIQLHKRLIVYVLGKPAESLASDRIFCLNSKPLENYLNESCLCQ